MFKTTRNGILCACLLLAFGALISGCASRPPLEVSETVGPARIVEQRGSLIVHTPRNPFATGDSDRQYCEDYTIYWMEGTRTRRVRNHVGWLDEGPVSVALPAGKYRIEARALRAGFVKLMVEIEPNQSTVVHLDGSIPKDVNEADPSIVRLPDGQIVGWKAAR